MTISAARDNGDDQMAPPVRRAKTSSPPVPRGGETPSREQLNFLDVGNLLKSHLPSVKGTEGRFKNNLLGKRTSGRCTICWVFIVV